MQIDEFLKLVRTRRSIRSYKLDPVPDEYVEQILEAGRWSPSSANSQPWDFIVVKDVELKRKIHEVILGVIEKIKTLRDFPLLHTFKGEYVLEAPVNIVVCGDPRFKRVSIMDGVDVQMEEFSFWGSVIPAIQNMILAAECLGLGSVVFTDIYPKKLQGFLDVPEPLKVICVLPIGYPAESPAERPRRELAEFTHRDRFDARKIRTDDFIEEARKNPYTSYLKELK